MITMDVQDILTAPRASILPGEGQLQGVTDEETSEADAETEKTQDSSGKETGDEISGVEASPDAPEEETEYPVTSESAYYTELNNYSILYSLVLDENHVIVIRELGLLEEYYRGSSDPWKAVLENEIIGSNGFAFVWSGSTGEILYFPDESMKGQHFSELGIAEDNIADGQFFWDELGGTRMYLYPVYFEEQDVWICCAVPESEIMAPRGIIGTLFWALFGAFVASQVYYIILLLRQRQVTVLEDFAHTGIRTRYHSRQKKLLVFTILSVIFLSLVFFYLETLYLMSSWANQSTERISSVEKVLERDDLQQTSFLNYYNINRNSLMRTCTWAFERNPELMATEELDELSSILSTQALWITDKEGNTIVSSSSYYSDSSNYSEAGSGESEAAEAGADSGTTADSTEEESGIRDIKMPILDEDKNLAAFLVSRYDLQRVISLLGVNGLEATLELVRPGEGSFIFAVDQNSRCFSYHPEPDMIGKDVIACGIKENQLQDDLFAYIYLNRGSYYTVTGQYKDDLIYLAIPRSDLLRLRIPVTLAGAAAALVIMLIIGLPLFTDRNKLQKVRPGETEESSGRREEKTAEYQVFKFLIFLGAIVTALVAQYGFLYSRNNSSMNVLTYVLDGNWEYGVNVFALTASFLFICQGVLIIVFIRWLADFMSSMLEPRTGTILRMLASLLSYIGAAVIFYRCLLYFGVDPTALMASAGIVSVVIGIGANSLVGDIIAGVFVLLEGNIQVGDFMTVDGFRGYVQELGIRMTKLYNPDSEDVKIIPNKDIQNIVHMSMHLGNIYSEFQITYEADLEKVEALILEELEKMKGTVPHLIGKPEYLGVQRLDDNGVVLTVRSKCHEGFRPGVTRSVNRRIYLMFCRNGIEVPFPQLTLHEAEDGEDDPMRRHDEPARQKPDGRDENHR